MYDAIYGPILRAKRGEFGALVHLSSRARVVPADAADLILDFGAIDRLPDDAQSEQSLRAILQNAMAVADQVRGQGLQLEVPEA